MQDARTERQIEESISLSTGYEPNSSSLDTLPILSWMAQSNSLAPAWWSASRDLWLSQYWKKSNHLSSAIYNAQSKLSNIPPVISPKDTSVTAYMDQAEEMTKRLMLVSEFGAGWGAAMDKFYEDYLTQDNGAFLEIIGDGPADGPIVGMPIAIRHLSSRQCTRTGDPMYPVVYTAANKKKYALHAARVIALSQMPSPIESMNGVGFCAVSRCFEVAQTMMDIVRYKQERLGSRPHSKMLIGKGIRASAIQAAFMQSNIQQDDQGLEIAGQIVAVGSDSADVDIGVIDLTHLDPFDEETSVTLGMYLIAAALGMDISEIWPTAGRASSTDARIAQARARGKLPSQVTGALAGQLNLKFLPPFLTLSFDFRDDEEDQQRALVRDIRGRHRTRETESGVMTFRSARRQMLQDGDIDREMFEEMEMADGRLDDGTPIARLFYSTDPDFAGLLDFSVEFPLDTTLNDPMVMLSEIAKNMGLVAEAMNVATNAVVVKKLNQAFAALAWLKEEYRSAFFTNVALTPDNPEDDSEDNQDQQDQQDQQDAGDQPQDGNSDAQ